MLALVRWKKRERETYHSDECAIRLINSLLVVQRIHWRKWGQEWNRLFICLVVRAMDVMWGRGLHELLPLLVSDGKLNYVSQSWRFFPLLGSCVFPSYFFFHSKYKPLAVIHMDSKFKLGENIPHRGLIFLSASAITLSLFLLLFSWLFFLPADGAAISSHCIYTHWRSPDLPQTRTTLLKRQGGGVWGESSLVPEFRQMFVEISGDFLVFFLEEKKGKKQSFFIGWAQGVLQLPLLVLERFFPLVE